MFVDGRQYGDRVLEDVVFVVLGDCFKVVLVLLVDKYDRDCFDGGEGRGVCVDAVYGVEGDISEGYNLCFTSAPCL